MSIVRIVVVLLVEDFSLERFPFSFNARLHDVFDGKRNSSFPCFARNDAKRQLLRSRRALAIEWLDGLDGRKKREGDAFKRTSMGHSVPHFRRCYRHRGLLRKTNRGYERVKSCTKRETHAPSLPEDHRGHALYLWRIIRKSEVSHSRYKRNSESGER